MLDQVLDVVNGGVSKHLGEIADSMYEWEGSVAEQLGLTPAEIAAIKMKHHGELTLQTYAIIYVSTLFTRCQIILFKVVARQLIHVFRRHYSTTLLHPDSYY